MTSKEKESSSEKEASTISSVEVGSTKESVINAVHKAMDLANWQKYLPSSKSQKKKIFVKINLLCHQVIPGHCTSPYVFEAVISKLRNEGNFEIYTGDANVCTIKQVQMAARNWGILELCKKYKVHFVNLSKEPVIERPAVGKIFKKIHFPKILTQVDYIMTVPVPKTHSVSEMTCALKNQWGCIPTFRHQYHDVVHPAIAEVNKALGLKFVVCDATICSEGDGPRTGVPKICNHIFASNDLVATDSFISEFIGVEKKEVGHIFHAEKLGLGNINFKLVGDLKEIVKDGKVISRNFKKAYRKNHPIVNLEMKLRKIPILKDIIFKTFLFDIACYITTKYNVIYWYNKTGKKAAFDLIKKYPLYREEFEKLILNQKKL